MQVRLVIRRLWFISSQVSNMTPLGCLGCKTSTQTQTGFWLWIPAVVIKRLWYIAFLAKCQLDLYLHKNMLWYSLEVLGGGASNEYKQHTF